MPQRVFRIAALLAALVLPHAATAATPPLQAPPGTAFTFYRKFIQSQAATAFLGSDYAALEEMSRRYRDGKSRTPIGSADLLQFYLAFDYPASDDQKEDERQLGRLERKALDWARAYPSSPSPHIVYAILLAAHGCAICAPGYTPERYQAYQSYLDQARRYLLDHKDVASKDPEWYAEMLVLADDSHEEPAAWQPLLAEAMDRYPYYYSIYHVGTMLYADSGSVEGLDDLVDDAVARTHATDGMELYARLYGRVGAARFDRGKTLFTKTHATWARMAGSYFELTRKYPDPDLFEEMFFYACVAGDKTGAKFAFPHLLPMRDSAYWGDGADFEACSAWVQAKDAKSGVSPLAAPEPARPDAAVLQTPFAALVTAVFHWFASLLSALRAAF